MNSTFYEFIILIVGSFSGPAVLIWAVIIYCRMQCIIFGPVLFSRQVFVFVFFMSKKGLGSIPIPFE